MSATIEWVRRLVNSGSASLSRSGADEKARYLIKVTEWNATPLEVVAAAHDDMPAYGSQSAIDPQIVVINKSAQRATNDKNKPAKFHWVVDVEWGVIPLIGLPGPIGQSDNSANIRIRISGVEETVLTERARDDAKTPIRNSLKDLYPDPQPITLYDTAIEIDYETDSIDNGDWDDAMGKINSADVSIHIPQGTQTTVDELGHVTVTQLYYDRVFPLHTLLLKSADREVAFSISDPSRAVWHNRVLLLYRADTWDRTLPDKGYRWMVPPAGGGAGPSLRTDWSDHPEYMDGEGQKLAAGAELVTLGPYQLLVEADLNGVLDTI